MHGHDEFLSDNRASVNVTRPKGWFIETAGFKTVVQKARSEIILRILFLTALVLSLWLIYDMQEMLYWYGFRMTSMALVLLVMMRLPDRLGFFDAMALGTLLTLDALLYTGLAVYFWVQELPIFMAYGLAVLTTAMITVIWVHAEERFLWICQLIAISAAMLILPFVHFFVLEKPLMHCILMFGVYSLVLTYFVFSVWSVWRTRAEIRRAQLVETQRTKVEAIGRLTAGVAHDFNNLLTVILGNIELSRLTENPVERGHLLKEAEAAGHRAARLTAQLLSFSRQSVLHPDIVDVAEVVATARSFLARLLPASIDIRVPPDLHNLPKVHLDASKLEAVIINLAINARDAMVDGGTLEIKAEEIEVFHGERADKLSLKPGRYVILDVTDTGTGIPQDIIERVTDPFFTTKPVGRGSGLGLSMAKGFAEQSGGGLDVTSIAGQGTRVRVYLPIADLSAKFHKEMAQQRAAAE